MTHFLFWVLTEISAWIRRSDFKKWSGYACERNIFYQLKTTECWKLIFRPDWNLPIKIFLNYHFTEFIFLDSNDSTKRSEGRNPFAAYLLYLRSDLEKGRIKVNQSKVLKTSFSISQLASSNRRVVSNIVFLN